MYTLIEPNSTDIIDNNDFLETRTILIDSSKNYIKVNANNSLIVEEFFGDKPHIGPYVAKRYEDLYEVASSIVEYLVPAPDIRTLIHNNRIKTRSF